MITTSSAAQSGASARGLLSVFGSTLFQLSGIFMLSPLILVLLKRHEVSTTVAGLFAATTWLGIFIVTPFASSITRRWGKRRTMWLATASPLIAALGFLGTDALWLWFLLELLSGMAGGLRWVLAEAFIAEFAPAGQLGRYVGIYATMVGATFIIGPSLLAWVGSEGNTALWLVVGLLGMGLAWTALVPRPAQQHDEAHARTGLHGLWLAVKSHPIIMLAGFIGGFFELGLASILPLYGLVLGLGASAAALLISISGMGSTLVAIPTGMLADRFRDPAHGRRTLMRLFASVALLGACTMALVGALHWLVWPAVFMLGGAGSSLYTLSMTDIGAREKGIALVNGTAVLVLTYTLGGLVASGISGALIDASPMLAFPATLIGMAATGVLAMQRAQRSGRF